MHNPFGSYRPIPPLRRRCQPPSLRHLAAGFLFALLLALPLATAWGDETFHSVVGFSSGTFMNTDRESAQAVARLWTNLLAKKKGGTADTRIFGSLEHVERETRSKRLDLLILLSSEYLELRNKIPLEPLFVSSKHNDINIRLALIVRRDSGIRTVVDLKNRQLIQQKGLTVDGHDLWLETLLMRNGIARTDRFFSSPPRQVYQASMAVMPVFFRKADACIVTTGSLKLMGELNPQLLHELVILAESPPRPGSVIAVRRGLSPSHRKLLYEILGTLDQDLQGQQLLTLFHMSSLTPFRPEYLVPLENLFKEYNRLKNRSSRKMS